MSSAASATAAQITIVTNNVKPSTPTMPPTVVYGPVTSGWMSHQSRELQPWTWAHSGRTLMAAATAMATVAAGEDAPRRPLAQERREGEQQQAADQRISNGSSAGQ